MKLEKATVQIHLDEDSRQILKRMKNKRLERIGYVMDFGFSLHTVFEFEDFVVKASNEVVAVREPNFTDEFAQLQLREIESRSDIAYTLEDGTEEKYEWRDYKMLVTGVDIVCDYVTWDDHSRGRSVTYDMKNIVALCSPERELVIHVADVGAQSVEMYESSSVLNDRMSIESLWQETDADDNPIENMTLHRTVEQL